MGKMLQKTFSFSVLIHLHCHLFYILFLTYNIFIILYIDNQFCNKTISVLQNIERKLHCFIFYFTTSLKIIIFQKIYKTISIIR